MWPRSVSTYFGLSRVKILTNTGTRMLYDFHRQRNAKSDSVHATYLISGFKIPTRTASISVPNNPVAERASSPFVSSSMPHQDVELAPTRVITLVREEELEGKLNNGDPM
jgi:DNA polymerase subunit Cdc27